MIILKLMGGLGNQMFQYAFGKSLSLSLNKKLVLDKSFLLNNADVTPRDYELSVFSIQEEAIVYKEPFGFGPSFPYRLNHLVEPFAKKIRSQIVFTDNNSLEELTKTSAKKIILEGYFQKEKYFLNQELKIREAFVFKHQLSEQNFTIKNEITNSNSVSLHVRRGDYITDNKTNQYHGVCSIEYYNQAIETLVNLHKNLHFFIFSDDIDWCKSNLKIPGKAFFVSNNKGSNSFVDMQLMSFCNHNIIANSSFSWWGAWLNNSNNKIVIAPKTWFVDNSINVQDLYPKKWLVL